MEVDICVQINASGVYYKFYRILVCPEGMLRWGRPTDSAVERQLANANLPGKWPTKLCVTLHITNCPWLLQDSTTKAPIHTSFSLDHDATCTLTSHISMQTEKPSEASNTQLFKSKSDTTKTRHSDDNRPRKHSSLFL